MKNNCNFDSVITWVMTLLFLNAISVKVMASNTEIRRSIDTLADDAVLAVLPTPLLAAQSNLDKLRQKLREKPDDADTAAALVQHYIDIARNEFEPRYIGYAEGVLQPWLNLDSDNEIKTNRTIPPKTVPPKILLLRATLEQHQHRFNEALMDLERLLQQDPINSQAWLTKATIHQTMGQYKKAIGSCYQLSHYADSLISSACLSSALDAAGHSLQAFDLLKKAEENIDNTTEKSIQQWVYTLLANYAVHNGTEEADTYFKKAQAVDAHNPYLLSSYSDYLLQHQQPQKVIALLGYSLDSDLSDTAINISLNESLLLQLALAYRDIGDLGRSRFFQEKLTRRFTIAEKQNNLLHKLAAAQFALEFEHDPDKALTLARSNWQTQKGYADKKILDRAEKAVAILAYKETVDTDKIRATKNTSEMAVMQ